VDNFNRFAALFVLLVGLLLPSHAAAQPPSKVTFAQTSLRSSSAPVPVAITPADRRSIC